MSEGARYGEADARPRLRLSDPATARFSLTPARPERADEGGGPAPGRLDGEQRIEKSRSVLSLIRRPKLIPDGCS